MILINIDQLTDSELRYIAQQENLDDWESLDRDGLIEEIRDFYGQDGTSDEEIRASENFKYVKGLTDVVSDVLQFPGVDELPETHNETTVHMVQIDSDWAYAFWSITSNKYKELEASGAELLIRLCKDNDSYEVSVSLRDRNWTVELPWKDGIYQLKLIARVNGEDEVLASSLPMTLDSVFLEKHPEMIADSDSFRLLVSPLIAKDRKAVENRQVNEILEASEAKK